MCCNNSIREVELLLMRRFWQMSFLFFFLFFAAFHTYTEAWLDVPIVRVCMLVQVS